MAKRYRTAYGAFKARRAEGLYKIAAGFYGAAGGLGLAGGVGVASIGGAVPGSIMLVGAAGLARWGNMARAEARATASRGRAIGSFIQHSQRLAMARGASKRSSVVMRAARSLNRSVRRSGGSGQVKGYYRQGPSGQVFVREYQRSPASR